MFSNLSMLMENYFMEEKDNSHNSKENKTNKTFSNKIPIVVSKSSWSKNDNTLSRIFEFDHEEKYHYFLNAFFETLHDSPEDIEMRLRKQKVTIVIRSKFLDITQNELNIAKEFDEIFKDCQNVINYKEE